MPLPRLQLVVTDCRHEREILSDCLDRRGGLDSPVCRRVYDRIGSEEVARFLAAAARFVLQSPNFQHYDPRTQSP